MNNLIYRLGIDIGSTTAKIRLLSGEDTFVFSDYRRHHGNINGTLRSVLQEVRRETNNATFSIAVTGSAAMGIAEKYSLPFVQELTASAEYIERYYPDVKTLIDIGGEDSKVVFFRDNHPPDIRMNSSCAGGTGAFIDQMATLLNISLEGLDKLAAQGGSTHPIASRCGVFAKTDVQNLLSREVPKAEVARSIFRALALQIKNTLMKGCEAVPRIAFSGGPLGFLSSLKKEIISLFALDGTEISAIDNPELVAASGAALTNSVKRINLNADQFIKMIDSAEAAERKNSIYMPPLFDGETEFSAWKAHHAKTKVDRIDLSEISGQPAFLGIDSGSTTTKIILTDVHGRVAFNFYRNNMSNPIGACVAGLRELIAQVEAKNVDLSIAASASTGYGEDLVKAALGLDFGVVETCAHFVAAKVFNPKVTFILDIGGQDMKAIFVKNGVISNIEINEACSSGCGSFIETFARSANYSVADFAELACSSQSPSDLGTRCTVFMNSKVKQSFREGDTADNISAGLAYSVIYNCLHKVLKIHDKSVLGNNIIVQGGTFKNPAVRRAFEQIIGRSVLNPDISELMGAYGAALSAIENYNKGFRTKNSVIKTFTSAEDYETKKLVCKACENVCSVTKLSFSSGKHFYTGNRCEKAFSNTGEKFRKGKNLLSFRYNLLFDRKLKPDLVSNNSKHTPLRIGIPRVLNLYENFPFWSTLFVECGFEVVVSSKSTSALTEKGSGSVMSDNICFPAKLTHSHIADLIDLQVDRIFYPIVTYEENNLPGCTNSFNCPVVSGYPDVIRRSMLDGSGSPTPLDSPNITFKDKQLLLKNITNYFATLGVDAKTVRRALKFAEAARAEFIQALRAKSQEIISRAKAENRVFVVLAGRPYHVDPLINHAIPDIFADFGFDVVTEDSLPLETIDGSDFQVLSQWYYPNRLYWAARWACKEPLAEFVQLNSFGCGPDSITIDETSDILNEYGKSYTVLRIDELSSPGSLRLRVRSLSESLKLRGSNINQYKPRHKTKFFEKIDRKRTILAPFFSPFHSSMVSAPFDAMGYNFEQLPEPDAESVSLGLQYVNNEICYPATLLIGDVLKALKSGKYKIDEVAVAITQTGGQCRASNYLSLIKKALVRSGFEGVPVIGVSLASTTLNYQPGFKLHKRKLIVNALAGIMYGDAISAMYYSTVAREINKGDSARLKEKYCTIAYDCIKTGNKKELLQILSNAVDEFNAVEISDRLTQKIGIVGEIYVKYVSMGNLGIVNELAAEGIEVFMPPLVNMFAQWFANVHYKHDLGTENNPISKRIAPILEKLYLNSIHKFDSVMQKFRFYYPAHDVRALARKAEPLMNMSSHYFGEGWLIASDIAAFVESGVENVLCFQPFGCIANHIVARGLEKALKDKYPQLNILYIDVDSGTSPVNVQNRIHLLLKDYKNQAKAK